MSQVNLLADMEQHRSPWTSLKRAVWLTVILWLMATGGACWLDEPVASRVYSSGLYLIATHSAFLRIVKAPGSFYFTVLIALLLWLFHPASSRPALLLCGSGVMAGGVYTLGKWMIDRGRPIQNGAFANHPFELHFFRDGVLGLIASHPNRSFPSGHTCLAFAMATALAVYIPQWRLVFFLIATGVGVDRLLEGAHYMSDVVAGAGFGVLATVLTMFVYEWAFSRGHLSNQIRTVSGR